MPRRQSEAEDLRSERFSSMEAALISNVPFFTVDYWDRSKFLRPTVFAGAGRGRGRERMYSYGDVLRLSIARALRDEQMSLETLRRVVSKLGEQADRLPEARFVLVGRNVNMAADVRELARLVESPSPGKRRTFAVLLDLTEHALAVEKRARRLLAERQRRAARA